MKAECPKNEKEFHEKTPSFLIQLANKHTNGKISDFSKKMGKGGAIAGTASMQAGTETWYFVKAIYKSESVSGVAKCDSLKQKLVAVSLGWDNGSKGSGVTGGPIE